MDTYTFDGVLHDEIFGVQVEFPMSFSIVLAPDADENLLEEAAKVVVFTLVDKMKDESQVGRDEEELD